MTWAEARILAMLSDHVPPQRPYRGFPPIPPFGTPPSIVVPTPVRACRLSEADAALVAYSEFWKAKTLQSDTAAQKALTAKIVKRLRELSGKKVNITRLLDPRGMTMRLVNLARDLRALLIPGAADDLTRFSDFTKTREFDIDDQVEFSQRIADRLFELTGERHIIHPMVNPHWVALRLYTLASELKRLTS